MTEHIVIDHPSKKLDEFMYKWGVKKHERLEALKKNYNAEKAIIL